MEVVCDPGATASMLSLENAEKINCNVRSAPGVSITTANGAALDLHGQTDVLVQTHVGKKLIHAFVVANLAQEILISVDDCEHMELLPKAWPNHELLGKESHYSPKYIANTAEMEEAMGKPDKVKTEMV